MLNYLVAGMTGLALTGNVYLAGWNAQNCVTGEDCCSPAAMAAAEAASAATLDMKNTLCIVQKEPIGTSTATVEYFGKAYHVCCADCIAEFKKDPQKYIKALEAKPLDFGIKQ